MQSKQQTELQDRVLFFDGTSAWREVDLLDKILRDGANGLFAYDKVEGIPQRNYCEILPDPMWLIPDEYQNRDVISEITEKATQISEAALLRVESELLLYARRGMLPWLRVLAYIKDRMEEEGVVWGVGRGSSVSSYVLYLMGIHSVDSLKFGLDIEEFLR